MSEASAIPKDDRHRFRLMAGAPFSPPEPDPMLRPSLTPEGLLESVRTLLVGSPRCPVYRQTPLQGRQEVCSAACGRARSRQRQAARLAARDAELRRLLESALRMLDDGRTS